MTGKLDPQIRELLATAEKAGVPPIHAFSHHDARAFYQLMSTKLAGDPPTGLDSTDRTITTAVGDIPLRIYRPRQRGPETLPALLYFHGGGWCVGGLDTHDHVCRWIAVESGCVVISVDYRMGPEHKFPAAVEDALAACQWVFAHAAELEIDASRIALGGDSAGGNLSAVISILAREQGGPDIACQVLIYPATDMLMSYPSHTAFGEGYRLTRSAIAWFITGYLRDGDDMRDFRASPLLAEDHSGLPPALILTAGFDPLLDEGRAYADKLEAAGVAVKYHCYEGMVHGFIAMPGAVDVARTALQDVGAYLKTQLCVLLPATE